MQFRLINRSDINEALGQKVSFCDDNEALAPLNDVYLLCPFDKWYCTGDVHMFASTRLRWSNIGPAGNVYCSVCTEPVA